jgi:hypothetical protein
MNDFQYARLKSAAANTPAARDILCRRPSRNSTANDAQIAAIAWLVEICILFQRLQSRD